MWSLLSGILPTDLFIQLSLPHLLGNSSLVHHEGEVFLHCAPIETPEGWTETVAVAACWVESLFRGDHKGTRQYGVCLDNALELKLWHVYEIISP